MPTNTPNLNLIKPLTTEKYTVAVANANNDILDATVWDMYSKSEVDGLVGGLAPQSTTYTKTEVDTQVGLLAPKANPTFTGTQTLPSIVTNGIKFPATQVPSADPNTLDDYERGTWTPVISSDDAGTITSHVINSASYVKIGNFVYINIRFTITNRGTGSGWVYGTLPFARTGDGSGSGIILNTAEALAVGTGLSKFYARRYDGTNGVNNFTYVITLGYNIN